jgi:DNA-binding transcriptional regulator/RsmH inhibitor MraZ
MEVSEDEYNVGVPNGTVLPKGRHDARVDHFLRIKMPAPFRDGMESAMLREWFIVSLDGVTLHMYPAAEWQLIQQEILERDEDGDSVVAFAEQEGIEYRLDWNGRILLPPQSPCSQRLRNQRVWLWWEDTHILIVAADSQTA